MYCINGRFAFEIRFSQSNRPLFYNKHITKTKARCEKWIISLCVVNRNEISASVTEYDEKRGEIQFYKS